MNRGSTILKAGVTALMTSVSPQISFSQQAPPRHELTPRQEVLQPVIGSVDNLSSFLDQQRSFLAQYHMIPIIVPRGERVGNSYHPTTSVLISSTDDCFPGLRISKDSGQLPSMNTSFELGLSAALGAAGYAEGEAGKSGKRGYVLSFRDVEVQTASVVALRNAIPRNAPQECLTLRPYLQAITSARPTSSPGNGPLGKTASVTVQTSHLTIPIVIGSVYYARRILRVVLSDQVDATAKVSFGESLLRKIGLDAAFKVKADAASTMANTIEFIGDAVVPVAYTAAFEVTDMINTADGNRVTITVAETDPRGIRQQVAEMEDSALRRPFARVYVAQRSNYIWHFVRTPAPTPLTIQRLYWHEGTPHR